MTARAVSESRRLRAKQAAEYLGCSVRTLYNLPIPPNWLAVLVPWLLKQFFGHRERTPSPCCNAPIAGSRGHPMARGAFCTKCGEDL